MKKIITSIAIAMLTAFVMSTQVTAQDYAFSTMPIKKTFILPAEFYEDTTVTLESTKANLANSSSGSMKDVKKAAREFKQFSRITKNFEKSYQGASDVKWDKHQTGYTSAFMKDGLRHMAWYSNSGAQTYAMVSYDESLLRKDVKRIVNNAFEDYNILLVNEIHKDGIQIFVLTIENEKNIKLVTVSEGELNIYKQFKKAA